jgi:hypothetical protein
MGMGACDTVGRICASIGGLGPVESSFQSCLDVPHGGLLLALPALLTNGLLQHEEEYFQLPKGYYSLKHIFLLLAFMTLARLKSIEDLRSHSPGEWGKLIGLDRIPEVRCMREKIALLAQDNRPEKWSGALCHDWINEKAEAEGTITFYIDGHVRVYHGSQTKLPRHYIAREKLCARATSDFWVNAADGQPFFYISKAVDPGLLQVMEFEIIPRLETEIKNLPNQPTENELLNNEKLYRYQIISDREGYSPYFMYRMWKLRIAVTTYNKNIGEAWPLDEFKRVITKLKSGEEVEVLIAEREELKEILDHGKFIGKLLMREVRRIKNGKQVSIISTDYVSNLISVVISMQDRWSQENYFGYMRKHFGLDKIIDYNLEEVTDTTKITNPMHKKIESEIRSLRTKLQRRIINNSKITLDKDIDTPKFEEKQKEKALLIEEILELENLIKIKKEERKKIKRHTTVGELPEEYKFKKLNTQSKHFIDTIKMIAYRAETAMMNIMKEKIYPYNETKSPYTIRSLLRAIYGSAADLLVNEENQTLTVKVHNLANASSSEVLRHLCEILTESETIYPGTNLRLIYKLVSD